jgi:hypothetical protein
MEAPSPSAPEPGRAAGADEEPEERFGPLVLRRTTKEDGRTLILYSTPDESQGEEK